MTLIIKELIIRGIVQSDDNEWSEIDLDKEKLDQYLEEMKVEIERECFENVMQKLESATLR